MYKSVQYKYINWLQSCITTHLSLSLEQLYFKVLIYTLCAWLQRHSMSELKDAVQELLQCIIMGLSYKNVYYQ